MTTAKKKKTVKGADARPAAGAAASGDCGKLTVGALNGPQQVGSTGGAPHPQTALKAQINTQCKCARGFA